MDNEVLVAELKGLRAHFDARFDALEGKIGDAKERQNRADANVGKIENRLRDVEQVLANMKGQWKWISLVAAGGGAGVATVAQQVLGG